MKPCLKDIEAAANLVYAHTQPTPQIPWPLLAQRCGAEVWVKHENHTPIGAFKVRGGLVYMDALRREKPELRGVITATRGNHGQSIAYAAQRFGLAATVVVPRGNNPEKNAAMAAFGAELVEHGRDYDYAVGHAHALAAERGLFILPGFDFGFVRGVATYGLELLRAAPDLDTIYVPIGLGSGICGMIAARDALGLTTRIVGVVAEGAPAYALSFAAGETVATNIADTLADGIAVRVPNADALRILSGPAPSASSRSPTRRSWPPWRTCSPTPTTSPKAPAPRRWRRCSTNATPWQERRSASCYPGAIPTGRCSNGRSRPDKKRGSGTIRPRSKQSSGIILRRR